MEEFKGDADLFIRLFTDFKALDNNQPGNLTSNLGNMNECLKRIKNPDLRIIFIKSLQIHPNYLDDFNDEELALVLGELTNPGDLANVLSRCSYELSERSNVLSLLIQNRINDMEVTNVLVSTYLKDIPADEWVENWKVIAHYLAKNENTTNIFMRFNESETKQILDNYEHLINILEPIVLKQNFFQGTVDFLLWPQAGWKYLVELPKADDLTAGCGKPFLLPIVAFISLLGIIPALIAGIIHLVTNKPIKTEIETHLKDFPGLKVEEVINGYMRQRELHERLKQNKTRPGFFQQKTTETPDTSLNAEDTYNKPPAQ